MQQEDNPFQQHTGLIFKKKLVKCYNWSTVLYDAENWTLKKADQKYLESSEMWRRKKSAGPIM